MILNIANKVLLRHANVVSRLAFRQQLNAAQFSNFLFLRTVGTYENREETRTEGTRRVHILAAEEGTHTAIIFSTLILRAFSRRFPVTVG